MEPVIRAYKGKDKSAFAGLMTELQMHIAAIDPLHFNRCPEGYGDAYAADILQRVAENDGAVFVAEVDGHVIGCVVIMTDDPSPGERLGLNGRKDARIVELVVSSTVRAKGIGSMLMQAAEEFAHAKGYDGIRTEVFTPNASAMRFYEKLGYASRCVDMFKTMQ